jgi:RNA recognition motif-containing protein
VSGLAGNIDSNTLRELFHKHGKVEEAKVYYHPITKQHLGYGFVRYEDSAAAKHARKHMHNTTLLGSKIAVLRDPDNSMAAHSYAQLLKDIELQQQQQQQKALQNSNTTVDHSQSGVTTAAADDIQEVDMQIEDNNDSSEVYAHSSNNTSKSWTSAQLTGMMAFQ